MILVVASMEVELEGLFGLDKTPDHWEECELTYTGIGQKNVEKTLSAMEFGSDVNGLLSVGFVGSIDPAIRPGDLCLIETVASPDSLERFYSDKSFFSLAGEVLSGYRNCQLVTLNSTASSSEEKKSFRSDDFSIIDRETYWVARKAKTEDLPFLGLRTVIDGVDQGLPPEFVYDGDTGKVKPGRFTSWLIKNPSNLGSLPRLGWNSVKARRRLATALNRVMPALLG